MVERNSVTALNDAVSDFCSKASIQLTRESLTAPISKGEIIGEFTYLDASDLEKDAEVWYVGDFLTPGTQLPDGLTPNNTTVTIQNGEVVELVRSYVP